MDASITGIHAVAPNIWTSGGATLRHCMTVVKLTDASVWIASPGAVLFETLKQITPVRYLVAETPRHVAAHAADTGPCVRDNPPLKKPCSFIGRLAPSA